MMTSFVILSVNRCTFLLKRKVSVSEFLKAKSIPLSQRGIIGGLAFGRRQGASGQGPEYIKDQILNSKMTD